MWRLNSLPVTSFANIFSWSVSCLFLLFMVSFTVQKHQFFGTQPSSQSNSHIHTWPLEKAQPWLQYSCLENHMNSMKRGKDQFSSVQSLSHVWLFATPWIAARQASLSITISRSSLRLTSIKSVMPSSHLILGYPRLLLPPITPSIRDFSNESTLRIRWPKYWSYSFSIIPSKEIPGLISFRMDWLDLLAV